MPIRWDEVERFARSAAEDVAAVEGSVAPTVVAYDGAGPFAVVTVNDPLPPVGEVVDTCVALLAPSRPVRLAAVWQVLADHPGADPGSVSDDGLLHGVWIIRGVRGPSGPARWTSTLFGYRRVGGRLRWADRRVDRPVTAGDGVQATGLRPILDARDHRGPRTSPPAIPGPPYELFLRPLWTGPGPPLGGHAPARRPVRRSGRRSGRR